MGHGASSSEDRRRKPGNRSRRRQAADLTEPMGLSSADSRQRLRSGGWRRWTGEHVGRTVAQRRPDGSRGPQPTVAAEPKNTLRRGATPETGDGCIPAASRDGRGWAARGLWVKTDGDHQGTAPRRLQADDLPSPAVDVVDPGSIRPLTPRGNRLFRRLTSAARDGTGSRRREAADK
jgi:hypothetical protein